MIRAEVSDDVSVRTGFFLAREGHNTWVVHQQNVSQRNSRVHQRKGEDAHHAVLDHPLGTHPNEEQNGCGEDENHQEFQHDVPDLGGPGFSEGLELVGVVEGAYHKAKDNGTNKHPRHAQHGRPFAAVAGRRLRGWHAVSWEGAHLTASVQAAP